MKKIEIITEYFYPVNGGIENIILESYSKMNKNNYCVKIHTSADTYKNKNCLKRYEEIRGLKINRYKEGIIGFWPSINWGGADIVCLQNFNIFPHLQILFFSLILKIFKKKKFKLVLVPHGGFNPNWMSFNIISRTVKKLYHNTIGLWLINLVVDRIQSGRTVR